MIIIAVLVACLVCLLWLGSRPDADDMARTGIANTSGGPSFDIRVDKPRTDRPFFGIFPTRLEAKLFGVSDLRFNNASPGARIGNVAPNHLELSADGWELIIETDSEGRVVSGTRLLFPIEIAEKPWTLRCRPADRAVGSFQAAARAGSDVLDGRFLVELAHCEDSKTGKILDTEAGGNPGQAWPSSPLTLRGSFQGLPQKR